MCRHRTETEHGPEEQPYWTCDGCGDRFPCKEADCGHSTCEYIRGQDDEGFEPDGAHYRQWTIPINPTHCCSVGTIFHAKTGKPDYDHPGKCK